MGVDARPPEGPRRDDLELDGRRQVYSWRVHVEGVRNSGLDGVADVVARRAERWDSDRQRCRSKVVRERDLHAVTRVVVARAVRASNAERRNIRVHERTAEVCLDGPMG